MKNPIELSLQEEEDLAVITNFPSPIKERLTQLSDEKKIEEIEIRFREILEILGLDLTDDSLVNTPHRIAKMYVKEIFNGLDPKQFPKISFMENKFSNNNSSNLVFTRVSFNSFCEHHFVPMNGTAYVAYIPNDKLIGLSKIPRIVKYFSQRPQVQERLTSQIADSLATLLDTENIAVSLTAEHFCVIARGIENESGLTTTNVLRGRFNSYDALRREFFEAINRKA